MDIISWLLIALGITTTLVIIILLSIQLLMFYGLYKLITKKPTLAIFLFILLFVLATLETLSVGGIALGVATYVGLAITLFTQYKRLKRGLKLR